MILAQIGLSHHTTPIQLRERFSCPDSAITNAYHTLHGFGVNEVVIVSTCNRVELYACAEMSEEALRRTLVRFLSQFHHVPERDFDQHLQWRVDQEAAAHLMRVAASLDSLVLGEAQILGQVRNALRLAQDRGHAGYTLTRLFEQALHTGKRVQTETGLGRGRYSVGHAAVEMAGRIFDDFSKAKILILGAGKMSEVTARHLVEKGVKWVVVANRTYQRAVDLAIQLGGSAMAFDDAFNSGLADADIVIASTAAPHAIIHRSNLQPIMRRRRGKPLFIIDIAIPRDVDPNVNTLENVFLYNVDDLQHCVHEDATRRAGEAESARLIAEEETLAFLGWYRARQATPTIAQLKNHLDEIKEDYMRIFGPRLAHLSAKDRQTIETMVQSMMDQVARQPIQKLKRDAAGEGTVPISLAAATLHLFGLDGSGSGAEVVTESVEAPDGAPVRETA